MTVKDQIRVFEGRIAAIKEKRDRVLRGLAKPHLSDFERKSIEMQAQKFAEQLRASQARLDHYKKPS